MVTASAGRGAKIRVLLPEVVPMSKKDEQQAIHAIPAMIAQWVARAQPAPDRGSGGPGFGDDLIVRVARLDG
jgi:hypothetical protein